MDEDSRKMVQVPLVALEMEQTRSGRTITRLCTIVIVLIVALAITNAAWLYAWMQYDYATVTQEGTINTHDSTQDWKGVDIVPEN